MAQNRSTAVMQQRSEAHDSLDFFPTPAWATRALCKFVLLKSPHEISKMAVLDPACGEFDMVHPLSEYFNTSHGSDIHDYGFGDVDDFLFPGNNRSGYHWIITNPPFRLGMQFIIKALETAEVGVAVLVRTAFLEGNERFEELFNKYPPSIIAQFVERVPMVKGRVDKKASSATAYCWIIWDKIIYRNSTDFIWIPKCRKSLEKPSDYKIVIADPDDNPLFVEVG